MITSKIPEPPPSDWYEQHRAELIARVKRICSKEKVKVMSTEEATPSQVKEMTNEEAAALPAEEKKAIAQEAKARGIKVVARERHLPWEQVNSWVGTYTRNARQPAGKKGRRPQSAEQPAEARSTPAFVEFVQPACAFCQRELDKNTGMVRFDSREGTLWYCRQCTLGIKAFCETSGFEVQFELKPVEAEAQKV